MAKKALTKAQTVAYFADKLMLPKKAVSSFFDELIDLATKETKKNEMFTMPGIGKLVLSKRKARVGRNPATGAAIKIPAKTVVKMRLSKTFKDSIIPPKKK